MSNKTDKEPEKGCRWWLQFVIVPLTAACVGGGGIVAIIVALIPVVFPTPPIPATVTTPPGTVAASTSTATPIPPTNTLVPPTDTPVTEPPTSTSTPTPAPISAIVMAKALNLRTGPSEGYAIIGQLQQGDVATVIGQNPGGDWLKVKHEGKTGWVSKEYVEAPPEVAMVPTAVVPPPPTSTPSPEPAATPTTQTPPPAPAPPRMPSPTTPPPAPSPTKIPPPTPTPPPFIAIAAPKETLACVNPEEWCEFAVRGDAGGVSSFIDLRIYTFVRPVDPPGPGWYLQDICADINADGSWVQSPSVLGDLEHSANDGDTLRIRAALVREDATFQGKKLSDFSQGEACMDAVEEIEGIIVLSSWIELAVVR